MAYSAFTINEGVCSTSYSKLYLPTCPLLTFDLCLLHLLSITNLALLLVILSTALSPNYYLLHSPSLDTETAAGETQTEAIDAFVMWDYVLESPSSIPPGEHSPPLLPSSSRSYGAVPATPKRTLTYPQQSLGEGTSNLPGGPSRRDKFAEGRLRSYVALLLGSIGAGGASVLSLVQSTNQYSQSSHSIFTKRS
jgi:hypothetical protein